MQHIAHLARQGLAPFITPFFRTSRLSCCLYRLNIGKCCAPKPSQLYTQKYTRNNTTNSSQHALFNYLRNLWPRCPGRSASRGESNYVFSNLRRKANMDTGTCPRSRYRSAQHQEIRKWATCVLARGGRRSGGRCSRKPPPMVTRGRASAQGQPPPMVTRGRARAQG
jgi:hypothetical protein